MDDILSRYRPSALVYKTGEKGPVSGTYTCCRGTMLAQSASRTRKASGSRKPRASGAGYLALVLAAALVFLVLRWAGVATVEEFVGNSEIDTLADPTLREIPIHVRLRGRCGHDHDSLVPRVFDPPGR